MNQLRKLQQFNRLRRICLLANRPASHPASKSFHQLVNDHDRPHNRQQLLVRVNVRSDLIQLQSRHKGKKAGKGKEDDDESDSDSDSDEEETDTESSDEDSDEEDSNIKKIETINTRLDMLIKNALGGSKSKVDQMISEDKFRVNNERVLKKSQEIFIGDVVDVINGFVDNDPERLRITRFEFLDIDDKMNARGKYGSKVKITRGLEVENYKDARYESLI